VAGKIKLQSILINSLDCSCNYLSEEWATLKVFEEYISSVKEKRWKGSISFSKQEI
jgi:hypothetical protein